MPPRAVAYPGQGGLATSSVTKSVSLCGALLLVMATAWEGGFRRVVVAQGRSRGVLEVSPSEGPMSRDRYQRSAERFGQIFNLVVGLGLVAGGGALLFVLVRDLWNGEPDASLWLLCGPLAMLGPGLMIVVAAALPRADGGRPTPPRSAPLAHVGLTLPLSTGASALAPFTAPLLVFHLVAFSPLLVAKWLSDWTVYPVAIAIAGWFFLMVGSAHRAWIRRPSDLQLGNEGLRIVGGPLHGTRHDWTQLGDDAAVFERTGPDSALHIAGEVVAESDTPEEDASLAALAHTVQRLAGQARGELRPARTDQPAEVIACPNCGAPVAPSRHLLTRCQRCDTKVPMPETGRRQAAATDAVDADRRTSERLLGRLLRQPSASSTTALLVFALPFAGLGFPIASVLVDELHQVRGTITWGEGLALFSGALGATYGLVGLLQSHVAGRRALRLVTTTFAATPPRREAEPWSCVPCGAPLPWHDDAWAVVGCAYCGADSIVGLDVVPLARQERAQARDLVTELARRLGEQRRHRAVAATSIVAIVVGLAVAWPVLAHGFR